MILARNTNHVCEIAPVVLMTSIVNADCNSRSVIAHFLLICYYLWWYNERMSLQYWLAILLTLLLTGFVGYGTYRTAHLLRVWQPDRNLLLLPAENGVRIGLILLCIGLGHATGLSKELLGWTAPQWQQQVLWGTLWGLLIAFVFYASTRWLAARTGSRLYSPTVLALVVPHTTSELALVSLAMAPVVILEEMLFRSLLLGGLSPVAPVPLLLIATGLIFGLMHSPQGIWGMVGAGLAGVLFGLLFLQYHSLVQPVAAHYVANMAQILIAMRLIPRAVRL
jgi:membrane protease YdiL (CAAX protease family)